MFNQNTSLKKVETGFDIADNFVKTEQRLISALHLLESLLENGNVEKEWQHRIFKLLSEFDYSSGKVVKADIGVDDEVLVDANIISFNGSTVRVKEVNTDDEFILPITNIFYPIQEPDKK